ncbi:MAG TPA: hypothetical protein VH210_08700 [Gaiellaceae bacterium]|nr:hypothetical protein [Gaiellaceae bacterium]
MSHRKLMAGLAGVATALAVALPASASAATAPGPVVPPTPIDFGAGYLQSVLCPMLVAQLDFATATGNVVGANVIGNVLFYSGCGGPAI